MKANEVPEVKYNLKPHDQPKTTEKKELLKMKQ